MEGAASVTQCPEEGEETKEMKSESDLRILSLFHLFGLLPLFRALSHTGCTFHDDVKLVPMVSLLDNHLSILKSLRFKSICYYQSLPLVQTFQNLHLGQMALIGCPFSYRGTHQD